MSGLSTGECRGAESAPVTACVARPAGPTSHTLARTVGDDVLAIEEQADIEADDAPAGADRAWWARV